MTAESAIKLPTERSIPAVMMTMVIPIAMTAMTTIRSTIARRWDGLIKVERTDWGGLMIGMAANSG